MTNFNFTRDNFSPSKFQDAFKERLQETMKDKIREIHQSMKPQPKDMQEEASKPLVEIEDYSIVKKGSKFIVLFSYDGDTQTIHEAKSLDKAKQFLRKELKDNGIKHEKF